MALLRINQAVNIANTVQGRPIYVLELSDWDCLTPIWLALR